MGLCGGLRGMCVLSCWVRHGSRELQLYLCMQCNKGNSCRTCCGLTYHSEIALLESSTVHNCFHNTAQIAQTLSRTLQFSQSSAHACSMCRCCACSYDAARCRLQRCRPPAEVARQEALMAAEWHWLRRVRMAATAAASSCSKQVGTA